MKSVVYLAQKLVYLFQKYSHMRFESSCLGTYFTFDLNFFSNLASTGTWTHETIYRNERMAYRNERCGRQSALSLDSRTSVLPGLVTCSTKSPVWTKRFWIVRIFLSSMCPRPIHLMFNKICHYQSYESSRYTLNLKYSEKYWTKYKKDDLKLLLMDIRLFLWILCNSGRFSI